MGKEYRYPFKGWCGSETSVNEGGINTGLPLIMVEEYMDLELSYVVEGDRLKK